MSQTPPTSPVRPSSADPAVVPEGELADRLRAAVAGTPEPEPDVELKGQALEEALDERGLPKTGSADEKRARVAEHDARVAAQTEGQA